MTPTEWRRCGVRPFDELLAEALAADVSGWGFAWLDGRATEERPPWGYAQLIGRRLGQVGSALDLDTGGGEVLDEAPALPPCMVATESWGPNLQRARERLGVRGVTVVAPGPDGSLPLPDASFDLVTARHPVRPDWSEIHRVLRPGGRYLAQHVGPASMFALIEHFLGPLPQERKGRDPEAEAAAARAAGLQIVDLRTARCRVEIFDVGAVVWLLRKCVWWVPGFTVEGHLDALVDLDRQMRRGEPFVDTSTRHLVEAERPDEPVDQGAS